jgi:hypothetical protein
MKFLFQVPIKERTLKKNIFQIQVSTIHIYLLDERDHVI